MTKYKVLLRLSDDPSDQIKGMNNCFSLTTSQIVVTIVLFLYYCGDCTECDVWIRSELYQGIRKPEQHYGLHGVTLSIRIPLRPTTKGNISLASSTS